MYINNSGQENSLLDRYIRSGAGGGKGNDYATLGEAANRYASKEYHRELLKDKNFLAGIQMLHQAEEHLFEANALVNRDNPAFPRIGAARAVRMLKDLDADETSFVTSLATARKYLVEARKQFGIASANNNHVLSNNIVPWTQEHLANLDQGISIIHPLLPEYVIQMAEGITLDSPTTNTARQGVSDAAIRKVLETNFPGQDDAAYDTAVAQLQALAKPGKTPTAGGS